MYGWIELVDLIEPDQIDELSNIGAMLKSQDIESQKLALSLLLAPEFDNLKLASVDCGPIHIRYDISTKLFVAKRNYTSGHKIYLFRYVIKALNDIINDIENIKDFWVLPYNLKEKEGVKLSLISSLTLTINRACEEWKLIHE